MPRGSTERPDTPAKRRLLALACLLSLGAAACDACDIRPQPERKLAAYVAAIDPDRGSAPPLASALQRLPPRPQRSIELPRRTTDIAGFLALQGCALGELVGHRNSGLGRVMTDSQRWVYEAAFLREADACLPGLDVDRRRELQEVLDEKEADLPVVVWNAIWGGPELQHLLALSGRDLDPGAGGAAVQAAEALGLLRRFAAEPGAITSADLEAALKTLRSSTAGGDVLRALEALAHYLDEAAVRLEAAAGAPDCERLRGVFERRYAGEVQPYVARTHQAAAPLFAVLWDLYEETSRRLPARLPDVATYVAQFAPTGVWGRYEAALRRHTAAWQRVTAACGFAPGAEVGG